jgi:hypothetical protein
MTPQEIEPCNSLARLQASGASPVRPGIAGHQRGMLVTSSSLPKNFFLWESLTRLNSFLDCNSYVLTLNILTPNDDEDVRI